MAMGDVIGRLAVVLGLDTAAFETNAKRASKTTASTGRQMEVLGNKVGTAAKALVGLGAAMAGSEIVRQVKDMAVAGLEHASALGEQAQQLGVTTGELQRYRYIATQVGIDSEVMDKGLAKLSITLGDLANGAKGPTEALKRLGLSQQEIQQVSKMTAGEAIPFLADGFAKLKSPTEAAAIAADLFGAKMGGKFLTLLMSGRAGIEGLTTAYQKLGIEISDSQIAKADEAMDKMAELQLVTEATRAKIAADNSEGILKGVEAWERLKAAALTAIGEIATGMDGIKAPSALRGITTDLERLTSAALKAGELTPVQAAALSDALAGIARSGKIDPATVDGLERLLNQLAASGKIEPKALLRAAIALEELKKAAANPPEASGWQKLGELLGEQIDLTIEDIKTFKRWGDNIWSVIKLVGTSIDWLDAQWDAFHASVTATVKGLFNDLSYWLGRALDPIFAELDAKLARADKSFYKLQDNVTGHSYIPDMVDDIGDNIGRLDDVMVKPIEKATARSSAAFSKMAREVAKSFKGIPDSQSAAVRAQGTILHLGLKGFTLSRPKENPFGAAPAGLDRQMLRLGFGGLLPKGANDNPFGAMSDEARAKVTAFATTFKLQMAGVGVTNVKVAKTFKDLADSTLSAIDRMAQAFSGGGFLDKLGAIINLGLQLGSLGVFGKGFQTRLGSIPAYANGTSFHPGGLALVGERGPEVVNLPRGVGVTPNSKLGGIGGGNTYNIQGNLMTPEFWAQIHRGDMQAATAGARAGEARVISRQNRRVA